MTAAGLKTRLSALRPGRRVGRLTEVGPSHVCADGPLAAPGDICVIGHPEMGPVCRAEVVGVRSGRVVLMPLDANPRLTPNLNVTLEEHVSTALVGDGFSGRLVDALARPLDGGADVEVTQTRPLSGQVPLPLDRASSLDQLETGVKALDGLLAIAKGQRVGIFAASGVGKTTLVTQIARQTQCHRVVLCLVGERGREVEAMWSSIHQGETSAQLSAVVATADCSPALRVRAVDQALALAEFWRDAGEDVVIVVDSITRYAMALREIGLAAGSPPALRAYTPNVFKALPRIVERCGALRRGGSITGLFSVLSETDDIDDPVAEAMKSYLDGHILLSRQMAESGQFPAIDVPRSVSRLAPDLLNEAALAVVRDVTSVLSTHHRSRLLIESGMYKRGSDPTIDRAILLNDPINDYLAQKPTDFVSLAESRSALTALMGRGAHV